jgi:hypothetical protein
MDAESLYFGALLKNGRTADLRLVAREHLSPDWQVIYDWIVAFVRQEKKLPRAETINGYYAGRPPVGQALPDSPEAASHYAQAIRDNAMRVAMEEGFTTKVVPSLAEFKPAEALEGAKKVVAEVTRNFRAPDAGLILADLSVNVRARMEDYYRRKALADKIGLPTPHPTISRATRGFLPGDAWGVLARPEQGKTWLMVLIAMHLYQMGMRVLFASMETPPQGARPRDTHHRVVGGRCIRCYLVGVYATQECPAAAIPPQRLSIRFDAIGSRLSAWRLLNGSLTPREEERLVRYYQMAEQPAAVGWGALKIVAAPVISTVMDLEAEILDYGPDIVLWDSAYIGLRANKEASLQEAASALVVDWKRMLERTAIPGVVSWHFNREVDEDATSASYNDAILTDDIARAWDILLGLFRPKELRDAGEAILRTLKTRDGRGVPELKIRFEIDKELDFRELGEPTDKREEKK